MLADMLCLMQHSGHMLMVTPPLLLHRRLQWRSPELALRLAKGSSAEGWLSTTVSELHEQCPGRMKCLREQVCLGAGRVEFTEYLPENTQGVLVQPVGDEGVLVVATDTQRGFGRLDQVRAAGCIKQAGLRIMQGVVRRHARCRGAKWPCLNSSVCHEDQLNCCLGCLEKRLHLKGSACCRPGLQA